MTGRYLKNLAALKLASLFAASLVAAESKEAYSLFNPVPEDQMRHHETDRPDRTDTPYTLDAGHFQMELEFAAYEYDQSASSEDNEFEFFIPNIKMGLTHNIDFQIEPTSYLYEQKRDRESGEREYQDGFGDIVTTLKVNLWGNDSGDFAAALAPFIVLPTSSDELGSDAVEGGVTLPLSLRLTERWRLGTMNEIQITEQDDEHRSELVNSVVLERRLGDKLFSFFEVYTQKALAGENPWIVTLDLAAAYRLTHNLQLDGGLNIGVTAEAPDLNPFLGMAVRY